MEGLLSSGLPRLVYFKVIILAFLFPMGFLKFVGYLIALVLNHLFFALFWGVLAFKHRLYPKCWEIFVAWLSLLQLSSFSPYRQSMLSSPFTPVPAAECHILGRYNLLPSLLFPASICLILAVFCPRAQSQRFTAAAHTLTTPGFGPALFTLT